MRHWILTSALVLTATGLLAQQQVFTSSGTFVVPPGVTSIQVELIGAGGNGAGNGGGGGGGGGYARGTYAVSPGTSYSIVVGTGGSQLATIIGGLGIFAGAGNNGTTVGNPNIGGGGLGGQGQGGQVNHTGGTGGGGYYTYFGGGGGGAAGPTGNGSIGGNTVAYTGSNCLTPGGAGGSGGGAPAGDGGKGAGFTDTNCTVSDPAANGGTYGAGGGGGNGIGSAVGIGGSGVCIISWNTSTGIAPPATNAPQRFNSPFSDHLRLFAADGSEHFTLLDLSGRVLWRGLHIEEVDLGRLDAGVYVVQVTSHGAVFTQRVVKATGQ